MLKIKIPATAANMGPGFDCLGVALDLYNILEIDLGGRGEEAKITIYGEGAHSLPRNKHNLIYRSLLRVYEEIDKKPPPLKLTITNQIPLARGLGSSAAAIVAGIVAGNLLSGQLLSEERLLEMSVELEGHPDNVAPALLGGLVISCPSESGSYHFLKIAPPSGLKVVICVPDFQVSTKDARGVLPTHVPLVDAVHNISRVSLLVGAVLTENWELLGTAFEDKIHQPYREVLIPGIKRVMARAREAGALAAAFSGSGPTVMALALGERCLEVGEIMVKTFLEAGINSKASVLNFNNTGAELFQD